jgi:hypothetical protein
MIKEYVNDLASQMGIKLSKVSLAGGLEAACIDYLLEIKSKSHAVSILIRKSELDSLRNGSVSGFLELKIRTALERLEMMLAP